MEKRISVRALVEFTMRGGDIDNRFAGHNSAAEGARIHRLLQKSAGGAYQTETRLAITAERAGVTYRVEGRADGIITHDGGVTVDEIKTTAQPLAQISTDANPAHWAQAMCYGHMLCETQGHAALDIQLTYYQTDTGEIRRFTRRLTAPELSAFFTQVLERYAVWAELELRWKALSRASLRGLAFPFPAYREGQRRLAGAVYKTIEAGGTLLAAAPTGIGKTMSVLFPSVKALGEEKIEKVFYLTARTVTRQAAQDAAALLSQRGARMKCIALTAKEKICAADECVCSPDRCPRAAGHFDRVNEAILDALRQDDLFTRETVERYAAAHRVCPFELALDISLWCDVIICDYNYVFDPQVYLKRFFGDGGGPYVFLVDEAHNLVDRARDMYSAALDKAALLSVKKRIDKRYRALRGALTKLNAYFLAARGELGEAEFAVKKERPEALGTLLEVFISEFAAWLAENRDAEEALLSAYFDALSFAHILELYDEHYVTLTTRRGAGVKLFCADPSGAVASCLARAASAVFFSATLTPPEYFASVFGCRETARYLALRAVFPRENLLLLTADHISTRYRDRADTLGAVADMIYETAAARRGNYLAFFPSYRYMREVFDLFARRYPEVTAAAQEGGMTEEAREAFLGRFSAGGGDTLVGFCVLGGVFSEGIDLAGDRLIGAVIVGVGLPQINTELDVIRDYYNESCGMGYEFAYRYPGMNKVLQAAGRVIRSETDRGVVLLIDDRFSTGAYRALFPEHWGGRRAVRSTAALRRELGAFWGET